MSESEILTSAQRGEAIDPEHPPGDPAPDHVPPATTEPRHSSQARRGPLDPPQVILAGFAVGALMFGIDRFAALHRGTALPAPSSQDISAAIVTLSAGVVLFVASWSRDILFQRRQDPRDSDFKVPVTKEELSGDDRATVWFLPFIVSAGLLGGLANHGAHIVWALLPIIVNGVLFWLTATDRLRDYPGYAFPILDEIGLIRAIAFVIGGIALIRGLYHFELRYQESTALLLTCGVLFLLAFLERSPLMPGIEGTGRHERFTPSPTDTPEPSPQKGRESTEPPSTPNPALPKQPSDSTARRPTWLIVLIALACLGASGYVLWRVVNPTTASSSSTIPFLVFAGIALVLAVGGERLTQATLKAGTIEVGIGFGPSTTNTPDQPASADGTVGDDTPKDGAALSAGLLANEFEIVPTDTTVSDAGSRSAHVLYSPVGEHLLETVGTQARNRLLVVRRRREAPSPPVRSNPDVRQLNLRGQAQDVGELLARLFPR